MNHETVYVCTDKNTVWYAPTQEEALAWLRDNPTGQYYNALHRFVINGGK